MVWTSVEVNEGGRSVRKHQEGERIKTSNGEQIRGLRVIVVSNLCKRIIRLIKSKVWCMW